MCVKWSDELMINSMETIDSLESRAENQAQSHMV